MATEWELRRNGTLSETSKYINIQIKYMNVLP